MSASATQGGHKQHRQTAMTTYNKAACHAGQHKEYIQRLHSAMSGHMLRHGSHSFTCKLRHACLLFRKRSTDGATSNGGGTHLIGAYYSFIDPEGMKG